MFFSVQACRDFVQLSQSQGKRWQRMLQYEHEQRLRLEEMVEQLAKQHSNLEKQARKQLGKSQTNVTDPNPPGKYYSVYVTHIYTMY
jgi:cell division protein FtsB